MNARINVFQLTIILTILREYLRGTNDLLTLSNKENIRSVNYDFIQNISLLKFTLLLQQYFRFSTPGKIIMTVWFPTRTFTISLKPGKF